MAFQIIGDGEHMDVVGFTYEPGRDGPDPHVHHHHSDGFRVLEGELELTLGPDRERVRLPAGGFALSPPGVVHAPPEDGGRPSRRRFRAALGSARRSAHACAHGSAAPVRFLHVTAPSG